MKVQGRDSREGSEEQNWISERISDQGKTLAMLCNLGLKIEVKKIPLASRELPRLSKNKGGGSLAAVSGRASGYRVGGRWTCRQFPRLKNVGRRQIQLSVRVVRPFTVLHRFIVLFDRPAARPGRASRLQSSDCTRQRVPFNRLGHEFPLSCTMIRHFARCAADGRRLLAPSSGLSLSRSLARSLSRHRRTGRTRTAPVAHS